MARIRRFVAASVLAGALAVLGGGVAHASEAEPTDPGVTVPGLPVGTSSCYVVTPGVSAGFSQYGPYLWIGSAYVYCPIWH